MKTELIESCRKSIEKNYCGGCQALEEENFKGNENCPYRMQFTYKNLGIQEKIKL